MFSLKDNPLTYKILVSLLYNRMTRRLLITQLKKTVSSYLRSDGKNRFANKSPRIQDEKIMMVDSILRSVEESIKNGYLDKRVARQITQLWGSSLATPRHEDPRIKDFYEKNGCNPPWLLVISPGHLCNLRCKDCYASSGKRDSKLDWDILDAFIKDAKRKWGIKLIVFSGGEPFAYRWKGKGILDIVEKNPDCLFLAFTNGTLIDKEVLERLYECKNLTPAFSVEGLRKETDSRRGKGIFDKVLNSMDLLKSKGLPFGISVTVNRKNCEKVLDDEFLDLFFKDMGVFYSFYFQYLPIGRNADFDLMPTASQRVGFYKNIWKKIKEKRYFLLDFWNHGTLVNGCIAAGRDGGYLYIDWNGKVMPCVFMPYSAGNIYDIYKNKTIDLDDLWGKGFLRKIRDWQRDFGFGKSKATSEGNLLRPCPYRDHHKKFLEWVDEFELDTEDLTTIKPDKQNDIHSKIIDYDRELARLFDPIWKKDYLEE